MEGERGRVQSSLEAFEAFGFPRPSAFLGLPRAAVLEFADGEDSARRETYQTRKPRPVTPYRILVFFASSIPHPPTNRGARGRRRRSRGASFTSLAHPVPPFLRSGRDRLPDEQETGYNKCTTNEQALSA